MEEFELPNPNRRGRWIIIFGVILALVAGGGGYYLLTQAQQQAATTGLPMVSVVVATREIPARKPIEEGDVVVRSVPQDATNAAAYSATADVVGRIGAVSIPTGALITRNLLASAAAGGLFSVLEPNATVAPDSPTLRAISLSVPDDRAVGGLIEAGQAVDVFVTLTVNVLATGGTGGSGANPQGYYTDKSTKLAFQNVPILAKSGTFYIIRVDEATAEQISHLQASGSATFSMALRPAEDTRTVDIAKLGETTNKIIEFFGLPIPVLYPKP